MVGGLDFKIGNQRVAHRNDHDLEKKPKKVKPKGEMTALSDDPVHQDATQCQKHHARAYKCRSDEEIAAFAHLKPCRFRKRDVCGQKHQRKQGRDGDIKHLSDRFGQTLRRLRYQAFESHRWFKKCGKDTKTCQIAKSLSTSQTILPSKPFCIAYAASLRFFSKSDSAFMVLDLVFRMSMRRWR